MEISSNRDNFQMFNCRVYEWSDCWWSRLWEMSLDWQVQIHRVLCVEETLYSAGTNLLRLFSNPLLSSDMYNSSHGWRQGANCLELAEDGTENGEKEEDDFKTAGAYGRCDPGSLMLVIWPGC
jgi:hypothetical protein